MSLFQIYDWNLSKNFRILYLLELSEKKEAFLLYVIVLITIYSTTDSIHFLAVDRSPAA